MNAIQCFDGLGIGEKLSKPWMSGDFFRHLEVKAQQDCYAGRAAKSVLKAIEQITPWYGQDFTDHPSTWIEVLSKVRVGLEPLSLALEGWTGENYLANFREEVDTILKYMSISPADVISMAKMDRMVPDQLDGLLGKTLVCEDIHFSRYDPYKSPEPHQSGLYEDFLLVSLHNIDDVQREEMATITKPHRLKNLIINVKNKNQDTKYLIQKMIYYFVTRNGCNLTLCLGRPQAVKAYGKQGKAHIFRIKRGSFGRLDHVNFLEDMKAAEFKLMQADILDTLRRSHA